MKTYGKSVCAAAAFALSLTSCAREPIIGGGGESVPVTITLDAMTRGTPSDYVEADGDRQEGSVLDREMISMYMLVYDSSTGLFKWNHGPITDKTARTFEVATGTYDFVFIANFTEDTGDEDLYEALDENDRHVIGSLALLRKWMLPRSVFNTVDEIPMVTYYPGVEVIKNKNLKYTDPFNNQQVTVTGIPGDDTWHVELERTGIRVSMSITLTAEQYAAWTSREIGIGNIPDDSYLLPGYDNDEFQSGQDDYRYYDASDDPGDDPYGLITGPDAATGDYTVTYDRIILPELLFTPNDEEDNALVLMMDIGGEKTAKISAPLTDGLGYTLPRNTWLHLDVSVVGDTKNLYVEPYVLPWNLAELENVLVDEKWSLTVDREVIVLPYNATNPSTGRPVNICTNYDRSDDDRGWTIEYPAAPDNWFTVSPDHGDPKSDLLDADRAVVHSGALPDSERFRVSSFTVKAGVMSRKVTVVQLPATDYMPDGVTPYVGAFWKSSQTGERLITIPRNGNGLDGEWMALVVDEGEDWIVLDREPSPDDGVRTPQGPTLNGNDPDFEDTAAYHVTGNTKMVSGTMNNSTGEIYFRIGLTGSIPDDEHRYGQVVLLCKTGAQNQKSVFHRIWIRQGEEADWLMHPTDGSRYPTGGSVGSDGAPRGDKAMQWSPYNLSIPHDATSWTDGYYRDLSRRGGKFAEYPSQAGAIFQFTSNNMNNDKHYAYHPAANVNGKFLNWDDEIHVNHTGLTETCPTGYRKPSSNELDYDSNDYDEGTLNHGYKKKHELDEFFLSLVADLEAQSDQNHEVSGVSPSASGTHGNLRNSAWGYYADGWFDRRLPGEQESSGEEKEEDEEGRAAGTAVATNTDGVAYIGRLFYNPFHNSPNRNASLFFPAAGMRGENEGKDKGLIYPGRWGLYVAGVGELTDDSIYLEVSDEYDYRQYGRVYHDEYYERATGMSIRCVKGEPAGEPIPPLPGFSLVNGQWVSVWKEKYVLDIFGISSDGYDCPPGSSIWTAEEAEGRMTFANTGYYNKAVAETEVTRTQVTFFPPVYAYTVKNYYMSEYPSGLLFNIYDNNSGGNKTFPTLSPALNTFGYRCVWRGN